MLERFAFALVAPLALLGGCVTEPGADDTTDPGDGKGDGGAAIATVADNLRNVYAATVDDTFIYWVDGTQLWRAPKKGGTPTLLLANSGEAGRRGLTTDGKGTVYLAGLASVRKVVVDAADQSKWTSGDVATLPTQLVRDLTYRDGQIYFSTLSGFYSGGVAWRVAADGSGLTEVSPPVRLPDERTAASLAVTAAGAFWTNPDVYKIEMMPAGATNSLLLATSHKITGLAASGSNVFWLDQVDEAVNQASLNPQTLQITTTTLLKAPRPAIGNAIVADAHRVYFMSGEELVSVSWPAGTNKKVHARAQQRVTVITLDADHIYWATLGSGGVGTLHSTTK